MTDDRTLAELTDLLSPVVTPSGLDLEDVAITPAGRRRVVRVLVDRDGGVNLDDIAEATKIVSAALDRSAVLGDAPYTLEVSSPGVDRPLTAPRHWRRASGRLVKVVLENGTTFTGRVGETGEDTAIVEVSGRDRTVRLSEVKRARVQVEFSPPGRNGVGADRPAADRPAADGAAQQGRDLIDAEE